ncbi:sodium:proton antiporter [Wenjunlia vitaminophila]|uniref:Sodium:proton antiporter n=2 Tax=Wenjunlia vitaminophila TaxID=76728 RepID=A0A0T6LVT3_WENVI|nr:sodium:proton antiporter [Wenjunlia vitaminophila]
MVPVAQRLRLPAPVLMTLFGLALALLPFVPDVRFPPHLILPLVLPPLLYAGVNRTTWRQFRANLRPILLLAVALVFVTTAAVASVANVVVAGLPLAAAVALGALIAPPDPVAATAVSGRLRLPRRLLSILEGEGLFNDVAAIVIYHVAIAAVVTGSFSLPAAVGSLVLSAVVACAVGFALGWIAHRLMGLLDDPTLQIALSLLVPFVSYATAQELRGSGVLAVLATALYLSEHAVGADEVIRRLAGQTFWEIVETLIAGVAFALIGLELRGVLRQARGEWGEMLADAGVVLAVVVLVRLVWLLPAAWLTARLHHREDVAEETPGNWRETVLMWWAGMRGVASVALALAVPVELDDGSPFPQRDVILFVAFAVVLFTLVGQGLTLPWLARRMRLHTGVEELQARAEYDLAMRASRAASHRLRQLEEAEDLPEELCDRLRSQIHELLARASPQVWEEEQEEAVRQRAQRMRQFRELEAELLSVARQEVLRARSEPGTDPELVHRVLRLLDVRSVRARG